MEHQYRHEEKHVIDAGQAAILDSRLSALMHTDPYARADGTYFIRSLYFDNDNDKVLREKREGAPRREKFRIRYYNHDPSFLRLEKKVKLDTLTEKVSARISEQEVKELLWGNAEILRELQGELFAELYAKMKLYGLKPKNVVDYERKSFVYPVSETRITFDYHIRTGQKTADFLSPELYTLPCDLFEDRPVCVLEIKYNAFLPKHIADAVNLSGIRRSSFSKYEVSRLYF